MSSDAICGEASAPSKSRQALKSAQTRRAAIDATIESLVECGFAKTTTLEVQRRAGLSRGALLHHFPQKSELLVAAIRQLAEVRGREIHERSAELPEGPDRIHGALDVLWQSFTHPLFHVSMELRTASRTDADLRETLAELELQLAERVFAQARRLFGPEVSSRPGFDGALSLTLQFMMGVAMTAVLHPEDAQVGELIESWKAQFPGLTMMGA